MKFPSPMGIFFISIIPFRVIHMTVWGFRPLWGSFLFLFEVYEL